MQKISTSQQSACKVLCIRPCRRSKLTEKRIESIVANCVIGDMREVGRKCKTLCSSIASCSGETRSCALTFKFDSFISSYVCFASPRAKNKWQKPFIIYDDCTLRFSALAAHYGGHIVNSATGRRWRRRSGSRRTQALHARESYYHWQRDKTREILSYVLAKYLYTQEVSGGYAGL